VWTNLLSQQFLRIYGSRIKPCSQNIICYPWLVLQVWKSPKKILRSGSICFKGLNRAIQPSFQTFWILGDSLCMLTRSLYKHCRSPWSTSCSKWSSGEFVIGVASSLSEQISVNSNLTQIFGLIQNPWRIESGVNNKKCSRLDFLPPWISPDFPSMCIYFSHAENSFQVLFLNLENLPRGACLSVSVSPAAGSWLAVQGGRPIATPAHSIEAPDADRPCPHAATSFTQ
jgi:hypothetical protein